MNRKSVTRARRKTLMRIGDIIREEALNRDDDGKLYPKKDRGYCIEIVVNGWRICSYDDSRFGAFQGAVEAAVYSVDKPFGGWTKDASGAFIFEKNGTCGGEK